MKKIISCILVMVMAISIFGTLPAKAESGVSEPGTQMKTDISVEGTDSFGNLLTSELTAEVNKQEDNNGCNVFSIEMNGSVAAVSFETAEDCTLVVAVYDESGEQMLASGNAAVVKGETEKTVTIETDSMPQYYYLRGFLVDSDTLRPICTVYESPNYTQEMQAFFAKTVNDFDSEKVLNLDESESNNFAVFSNETIIIEQNETTNCITKADENTRTYVIANADNTVKALKNGDVFTCENGAKTLIVKVDSIFVSGTTVTIYGQDTSVEEVFAYVKIDTTKQHAESSQQRSSVQSNDLYTNKEPKIYGAGISNEIKPSCTKSIEFSTPEISQFFTVGVSGGMEMTVSAPIKFYYNFKSLKEQYLYTEFKIEYTSKISAAIEGEAKLPIDLGEFNLPTPYGINIGVTVTLEIGVTGKTEVNGTVKGSIGFSYDSDEDKARDISSLPEFNSEFKTEAGVFLTVSVKPNINFLNDDIADIELALENEIEAKGEKVWWELKPDGNEKHTCKECIDGEIHRKVSAFFNVKLKKRAIFKNKLNEIEEKWCDFYYSLDHDEFGIGSCPHKQYRVMLCVQDVNGDPISGAEITSGGLAANVLGTTDENGRLEVWLSNGDYTLTAKKEGVTTTRGITVHDDAKSVVIHLEDIIQEAESNIAAVDLIDKSIPEIISLMNGEYQIIKTENDGYIYIQNQSVLPGMEFYIQVLGDDIIPASNGEELHSDSLKTNLESGKYPLDGIQVNQSGKIDNSISADMDYTECCKVLGNFNCVSGTGAYLSGAPSAVAYTYNVNNAAITLYFEITSDLITLLSLGEISSVSSEQMKSYNPKLGNVVIRKDEANINSVLLSEKAVLTVESNNVSSLSNVSESTFALKQSPILMANESWGSRIPLRKAGSSSYWGMSANEIYNYYVLKSNDESDLFANDNILYIGQYMSDDQGHLITEYNYFNGYHYYGGDSDGNSWSYDRERFSGTPEYLLKAMSKTNLSSAQVIIPDILCNGSEQFAEPEVTLNGETLTEGVDYDIEKRYSATYPGEYELVITGIRNYTGEVSATYNIYCEHNFADNKCTICKSLKDTIGDANGDGVVGVADLVVLQSFLLVKRNDISINADINQDGVINGFDLVLLRKIVSSALN